MRTAAWILTVALGSAACGGSSTPPAQPTPDTLPAPAPAAAPWGAGPLAATSVPSVYLAEWTGAENAERCALVAFANPPEAGTATVRGATFSGGWGVAYDLPEERSAFGVAGTGVSAAEPTYEFPNDRAWADGSRASYGPEGGTGPNQLAYLRIAGQDCLYNVWSRLGQAHLEALLEQIRFVDTGAR